MSTRVFVGNLDYSVSDQYLAAVFRGCEGFESAHAINNRTGRAFGFGYVDFESRILAFAEVHVPIQVQEDPEVGRQRLLEGLRHQPAVSS